MVGRNVASRRLLQRVWYLTSSAIVILVLICSLILVGLRLFGLKPFTVMSGSMEPNYPVGALVYVREVDAENLEKGEVITFVTDDGKVVTHRIVEKITEEDDRGETSVKYRTKGDANEIVDGKLVLSENVLGVPVITMPGVGYVAYYLQQPPWIYIVIVVGTLLVASAAMPSIIRLREKRMMKAEQRRVVSAKRTTTRTAETTAKTAKEVKRTAGKSKTQDRKKTAKSVKTGKKKGAK